MRKAILIVGLVLGIGTEGALQARPDPDPSAEAPAKIPPAFTEKPGPADGFSGDSRIRIRRFHAITLFDTKSFGANSDSSRRQLKLVLDTFNQNLLELGQLKKVFSKQHFEFEVTPTRFDGYGDLVNRETLDTHLDQLGKPGPAGVQDGDVVFFWSQTHGEGDGDDAVLLMPSRPGASDVYRYPRKELLRRLEFPDESGRRRTHLTVFITERCATPGAAAPAAGRGTRPAFNPIAPRNPLIWRALYFGHQGTVDITSSGPGQPAVLLDDRASIFMEAFRDAFDSILTPRSAVRRSDDDGFVEWDRVFKVLEQRTGERLNETLLRYFEPDAGGKVSVGPGAKPKPKAGADADTVATLQEVIRSGGQQPQMKATAKAHDR